MPTDTASGPGNAEDEGSPFGVVRRATAIALIAFFTLVDLFSTQAILPSLVHAYGVTPAAMGLAVNTSTFGMAIASLVVALVSGGLDRRRGIVISLCALSVPTLLLAVAPDLTTFAALRFVQGVLMASAFTLTLAYLGEQVSASEAATAFAAYVTGNVASNIFGRLMAAAIVDQFGVAANFIAFAALDLVGALLAYVALRRSTPMRGSVSLASIRAALKLHLSNGALCAGFAIGFCLLFAFVGVFTYVNFVLVRPPLGIGTTSLGLIYFVFFPSIITTFAAGSVVSRFGMRQAMVGALAVTALGLPLLLTPILWLVIVGLGLVAIGTFFAQALTTGFVSLVASGERGAANGIYLASYFLGGLAGSAALGWIFVSFGWVACVGGVAASLVAAALLATRLKLSPAVSG
jgi:MFS transporter, YNFM family, putative membrane transport protein